MSRRVATAGLALAAIAALAFAALRPLFRPGFVGDGVGYYAPLGSWLVDRDWDFRDEFAPLGPRYVRAVFLTPDGQLRDPFPIGPALLWAPAVLLVQHLPANAWLDAPVARSLRTPDAAFAPRFARAVLATDVLLVILAVTALGAALASRLDPASALVAGLASLFATPLAYYVLVDSAYGHAACYFAAALLVAAVWVDRGRRLPLPLLGFLVGLAALVRVQDVLLGVLLWPRLAEEWRDRPTPGPLRAAARLGVRVALPAALAFAPQMATWTRLYGRPLLVPPGPEFVPWWKPAIAPFLLSTWNGAFVWSPLLLAACVGLVWVPDRGLRRALFVALALEIYACALPLDWWGGAGFGARRFVSTVPLVTVGLACLLDRLRRRPAAFVAGVLAVAIAIGLELRLVEYKSAGLLPNNPGDAGDYLRQFDPGSPDARRWGRWDYPRLVSEFAACERTLRARRAAP